MKGGILALAFAGGLGAASVDMDREVPLPPPLVRGGVPNPRYAEELKAKLATLEPDERKAFFRLVRQQQRDVRQRIEEMRYTLGQAQDLEKSLDRQSSPLVPEAERVVSAQRVLIAQYKALDKVIARERATTDPQRIDADPLIADLYAGVQFSSLYRDPDRSSSFFSKSRPFVALDIRQAYRRPGDDQWVEAFGTLSFQAASKETSDTVDVITTSGHFRGEVGGWWMRTLSENVSWGVIGSMGIVGYTQPETAADLTTSDRDQFRNRMRIGLTLRQEEGSLRGSVAEMSYVRDPLFLSQDRLFLRGRVVLTSFGSMGSGGDFYMEGSVSKGRSGRDEAVLLVGIRLDTLSFLRGLGMKRKGD